MGVLGGIFVLKSGLRILIRAPQVPFLVPPKTPKMGHFGCLLLFWGSTHRVLELLAAPVLVPVLALLSRRIMGNQAPLFIPHYTTRPVGVGAFLWLQWLSFCPSLIQYFALFCLTSQIPSQQGGSLCRANARSWIITQTLPKAQQPRGLSGSYTNLGQIHHQNPDHASTTKSQPNISISTEIKLQNLDQTYRVFFNLFCPKSSKCQIT